MLIKNYSDLNSKTQPGILHRFQIIVVQVIFSFQDMTNVVNAVILEHMFNKSTLDFCML